MNAFLSTLLEIPLSQRMAHGVKDPKDYFLSCARVIIIVVFEFDQLAVGGD
jgi:hypothetical protein